MKTHRVHFRNENVTIQVADGANLRAACIDSGIDPYPVLGGMLSCRGKGFCGTCAVEVDQTAHLTSPGKREIKFLKKKGKGPDDGFRLSCQAGVTGDVIVTTAPDFKPAWETHPFYSGRPVRSWEKES